jgi:acetyltransferase-like isoleucine patch superfamily enzyme
MKFNDRGVNISSTAHIGSNVRIGDNTTIYDNVSIGDDCVIANDCVIGEPLSDYYTDSQYMNPRTVIGKGSMIRSHSILYAGSSFGDGFSTGHRVTIRENSAFGKNCRVGTLSDVQGNVEFGQNCWLHSNVHVGQQSKVGNFVMIYPYVVLTNDPTPPSNTLLGVSIGDFSQIAVSSVLLPGVHVGKHALVGASSVVGMDVDDYALVVGSPAKKVKDVREIKSRETGESHYPWPYRFERGMPWEGQGFDQWLEENED